ncbi:heme biosynthesis HemY N-terminal domain-containing protein [Bermanella sp. R86510]|uniref:heme biosynthesis HemY N-terminal domain-containing protein n=1 Tax=unclassified Bermanella TaxID=2627862 RepID=UPI0037C820E4
MKRTLLGLLVLLLVGSILGHYMLQGSGYVLISFNQWVIETSLWVFIIALTSFVLLVYGAVHLVTNILQTPSAINRWKQQRGINAAVAKTVKGLIALAEGNWNQAEKQLLSGAKGNGQIINYLAAARAAQYRGDYQYSDELIAQAAKSTKGAELAVGLQHAQLQIEREQFEQALATCLRLKKQFPKHQFVNKMLLKTYTALDDWQAVLDVLPQLNKHKLLPTKKFIQLELQAYEKLIRSMIRARTAGSRDPKVLLKVWQGIPARTVKQAEFSTIAYEFIEHLKQIGAEHEAESELRKLLPTHFDGPLVKLYGWVKGKDIRKQLLFARDQVKERPNDADLLLTLGRICLMNTLFTEAQEYFEASLSQLNRAETRSELSRLYLANGQTDKAVSMLKQGLGLELPELPLPEKLPM